LEKTVLQHRLLLIQLREVVGDEVLVRIRWYTGVVLDAPLGGREALDACGFAGVDQVSLHDVVDVEMDDEEGEADVEALEGGGESVDVVVVDFLVEDAWDR
jgi:hypothetical protein